MTPDELKYKIEHEPDFVNMKRFGFSLNKLLERYPDGSPAHVTAAALMMTEEEVEGLYQRILEKLRTVIK